MGNGIISRVYAMVCKVLWLHVDEDAWMGLFAACDLKGFSFYDLGPSHLTFRTPGKSRGEQRFLQKDVRLSILYKSQELDTTKAQGQGKW